MKLRVIILILALFAFLSASAGGWLYYYSYHEAAYKKTCADTQYRLTLLTDQLSIRLSEHVKPVKALSGLKLLKSALENTSLDTIYQANRILDHFSKSMGLDVCYLMDREGVTLCSSNRNDADSFVGKDFSFRPYYHEAVQGKPAIYLALGTTSNKRGIYYSHPVRSDLTREIIGIAVIKSSVEFLEDTLPVNPANILMLMDPNGLIFMSNTETLRFGLFHQLSETRLNEMVDSRQFGNGPWPWTGFSLGKNDLVISGNGDIFLHASRNITNFRGWKLVSLWDKKEIHKQVTGPFLKVIGPVVVIISILAGFLVISLYQMAARELSRRRNAEKQLKISEKRYRRIYHKTPVMLHSIDPEGHIIHVSDHWVDVMGYDRKEVIGRPLIDFFSEESKRYAINEIFPKFFSTGFCKDVPYTYIKKNGEVLETLLSCYGVRNEKGAITRTLAVSVDVTEKNLVQSDLEKAKEKLSSYSLDLEQQVKRRTAQLEKAQNSLKELSKNIIASQEREKEAVARELHDHLGQVLTALRIDAVWMEKLLGTVDVDAQKRAGKMSVLIENTICDVREMAYRLRPRVLDDLGLSAALESLVADFERRSNVSCIFRHDTIPEIDKTLATALYRIGQEAVTNSLRHSNASTILVELQSREGSIILMVTDDGCGFELNLPYPSKGLGLESMRERANIVGGIFSITASPGKGTCISCRINVS